MGASYYAYAVIGVEVTGKLHTIEQRPSCEHEPSGTFCSTCGKPNKPVSVKTPVAGYDEDRGTLGALRVVHTTDGQKSFAGIAIATGDINYRDSNHRRAALSIAKITDEFAELRRQLTETGLWDDNSFGLWAVGSCSY